MCMSMEDENRGWMKTDTLRIKESNPLYPLLIIPVTTTLIRIIPCSIERHSAE